MPTGAENKSEEKNSSADLELIKPALEAVKDNPEQLYKMGLSYKQKNLHIAFLCFEKAKEAASSKIYLLSEIEREIGDIYRAQEKWNEAVAAYESAVTHYSSDAYLSLARLYYEGKGVVKDLKRVSNYLKMASNVSRRSLSDEVKKEAADFLKTIREEKEPPELLNALGCFFYRLSDYNQAFSFWEASAEQGFAEAYANLSEMYRSAWTGRRDLKKSKEYAEKALERGDSSALRGLGKYYSDEAEYKEAYECHKKAADSGAPDDLVNLGTYYYYGRFVKKDVKQALDYFIEASLAGNSRADSAIRRSDYYYCPSDIEGFSQAAESDPSGAQLNTLGEGFIKQWKASPKRNFLKMAFTCFKGAAQKGYPQAFSNLGVLHQSYSGFKDLKKAITYYQQALEKGDDHANYLLGTAYLANKDKNLAYPFLEKAAALGNALALKILGDREEDKDKALDYYLQAIIAGGWQSEEVIKAIKKRFTDFYLSMKFADLLRIAKEKGAARANYYVGSYVTDIFSDRHVERSKAYYEKAINSGLSLAALAANDLGNFFWRSKDYKEAYKYYQMAAAKGEFIGLINLGDLYRDGQGVAVDEEKAQACYLEAFEKGERERARARLKKMERVPPSSISEFKTFETKAEELYKMGIKFQEKKAHEEALTCLEAAAKLGYVAAYTAMGNSYRALSDRCREPSNGANVRDVELIKRYDKKAFEFYQLAAKQDDATASLNLGYQYLYGRGVLQNFDQALACFEAAKAKGLPQVDTIIGNLYLYRQNYEQAYSHFSEDAKQGVGAASYKLGYLYQNAMLEVKEADSADLALHYYAQACAHGFKPAEKALAQLTPLEWKELEEFNKAKTAADNGEALYQLGLKYDQAGAYAKACFCFKAAEKWEHEGALYQLGCYYASGKAELVERDYKKAESYFKKLIAKNRVEGHLGLGQLYESQGDTTTAIPYLSHAAEEGNTAAQLALGAIYSRHYSNGYHSSIINGLDFYELAGKEGIQGLRELKDKYSGPMSMIVAHNTALGVDCYLAALSLADVLLAQPHEDKEALAYLAGLHNIRPIDWTVKRFSKPYIQGLCALKEGKDIEAINHFKEVKQQTGSYSYLQNFFHAKACLHLAALYQKTLDYFPHAMQEYQEAFEKAKDRPILRKSIMAKLDNLAKDQAYMSHPELMRARVSCLWREAQLRLAAKDQEQAEKYLRLAFGLSVEYSEKHLNELEDKNARETATTTANQIAYEYANFIKEKDKGKELGLLEILCKRDFLPALIKLATYKMGARPEEAIVLFQRALNLALEKNDFPALFSILKELKTFYQCTPSLEFKEALTACFEQIFSSSLLSTQKLDWQVLSLLEEVAKETGRENFSLKANLLKDVKGYDDYEKIYLPFFAAFVINPFLGPVVYGVVNAVNLAKSYDYEKMRTAAALVGRVDGMKACASRYLKANDFGRGMLCTFLTAAFDSTNSQSHIEALKAIDPSSSLARTFFQKQDTEELKLMKGFLLKCLTDEEGELYLPTLRQKYTSSDPLILLFLLLKKMEEAYFPAYETTQVRSIQTRIKKSIKLILSDDLRLSAWEKWTSAEKIYDQKWKEMELLVDKVDKQAPVTLPEQGQLEEKLEVGPRARASTKKQDKVKTIEDKKAEEEELEKALKELEEDSAVEKEIGVAAAQGREKEDARSKAKTNKKEKTALSTHPASLFNSKAAKTPVDKGSKAHKPHTKLSPISSKTIVNKS